MLERAETRGSSGIGTAGSPPLGFEADGAASAGLGCGFKIAPRTDIKAPSPPSPPLCPTCAVFAVAASC